MLPPPESLCTAAAVVLEHLRTDGLQSGDLQSGGALASGLCGYVVWPRPSVHGAPANDLLYRSMTELLAHVPAEDPLVQETAWGSVVCAARESLRQVTCETRQGEVAVIVPAPPDLPTGGTVLWFTAEALASLLSLAHAPRQKMWCALGTCALGRV